MLYVVDINEIYTCDLNGIEALFCFPGVLSLCLTVKIKHKTWREIIQGSVNRCFHHWGLKYYRDFWAPSSVSLSSPYIVF